MKKFSHYAWFMIVLLILSACSLLPGEATIPQSDTLIPPDGEEPAVPTEVAAQSIFGPGTFNMDIPDGWDVIGPDTIGDDASGRSYDLWRLGEDPSSSGGPGTSHVIVANAIEWTPEELAEVQCSTCPDNGFEQVIVGGKQALRTVIGGSGVPIMITWYYVENQGNLIAFAIHDPQTLEPLDSLINTIIFE